MCTPSMPACGAVLPTSLSRPTTATGARQALQRERGGCCAAMAWHAHQLKAVCWRHRALGIAPPILPNFSCTLAPCSLLPPIQVFQEAEEGQPGMPAYSVAVRAVLSACNFSINSQHCSVQHITVPPAACVHAHCHEAAAHRMLLAPCFYYSAPKRTCAPCEPSWRAGRGAPGRRPGL